VNTEDPANILDYSWDWSIWLAPGDSIATSEFLVPAGLTQATPDPSISGTTTTVWLTGGVPGQLYTVTNRITTIEGRTKVWSRQVYIQNQQGS
jgi:hypothetical protein